MKCIELANVYFAYSSGRGKLEDINLKINDGQFVLLVGPSGAGKSTLLRLLTRLEDVQAGIIYYAGKPLSDYSPSMFRTQVNLVSQTPCFSEGSIRDALLAPFGFVSNKERERPTENVLEWWLTELNMKGLSLDDPVLDLSVGQKQRISLIRALLLSPQVLLLDEPTSALDADSRSIVHQIVEKQHQNTGMSVIQVDHSGYRPTCEHVVYKVDGGKVERVHE